MDSKFLVRLDVDVIVTTVQDPLGVELPIPHDSKPRESIIPMFTETMNSIDLSVKAEAKGFEFDFFLNIYFASRALIFLPAD